MSEDSSANTTDERTNTIKRRSLMKTIGAAGSAAGLGILSANTASANQTASDISSADIEKLKAVKQQYTTSQAAENAILSHGEQLLEKLKNRDVIESETELNTTFTPKKEYAETAEGMGMTSFLSNGVSTAHIYTSKKLREQHLTVVVQPQIQRSYAILRPAAADHSNVVTMDASGDDTVTSQAVCRDEFCLYQSSSDDPTPGDNCWLDRELYNRYHLAGGGCYLSGFIRCCDIQLGSCNYNLHCGPSEACYSGGCV